MSLLRDGAELLSRSQDKRRLGRAAILARFGEEPVLFYDVDPEGLHEAGAPAPPEEREGSVLVLVGCPYPPTWVRWDLAARRLVRAA